MKKTLSLFSFLFIAAKLFAQTPEEVEAYVSRYKQMAMEAQVDFGIPAAVTLAQGLHESSCGKSVLATEANNHFGIKCKSTWRGETILHDDDAKQECFRRYAKAEDSYNDHSHFLKDQDRYHFLFDIKLTDYKGWASGLKRAGYATNPAYVTRLTDLIEKYNLQQYTYEALNQTYGTTAKEFVPDQDKKSAASPNNTNSTAAITNTSPSPNTKNVPSVYFKGLKGFWAKTGQMLQDKAFEFNIRYPRLLLLNDLADAPLEHDQFIFIEKKRKVGPEEYHQVKEGEDMHLISQREAMALDNLYLFNNLRPGQEPLAGERLNLQYKSYTTPKIRQIESTVISTNVERPVVIERKEADRKEEVKKVEVMEPVKQEPKVNFVEENLPSTPEPIHSELQTTLQPVVVENKTQTPTIVAKQALVVETRIQPTLLEEAPKPQPKQTVVETRVQPTLVEEAPKPQPNVIITERIIKPAVLELSKTQTTPSEEQIKAQQPVPAEIKEESKAIPQSTSPILDEEKARHVEAMFAPDQKSEIPPLSEQQKRVKEEKERIERELLERKQKNDEYVKSVTDRIDEERKKQEALQDEEIRKRRAMEEEERKRIDQEQKERDRLEAEAKEKTENGQRELQAQQQKQKEEELRLEKEKEALRIREEEAKSKRLYNEAGTSDTIRDLKRKWDGIVYRTLPERKPLVVVTAKDSVAKPMPVAVKPITTVKNQNNTKQTKASTEGKKDTNPHAKNQPTDEKNGQLKKKSVQGKTEKDKNAKPKGKEDKQSDRNSSQSKNVKGNAKVDGSKSKTKDKSKVQLKANKADPNKKK